MTATFTYEDILKIKAHDEETLLQLYYLIIDRVDYLVERRRWNVPGMEKEDIYNELFLIVKVRIEKLKEEKIDKSKSINGLFGYLIEQSFMASINKQKVQKRMVLNNRVNNIIGNDGEGNELDIMETFEYNEKGFKNVEKEYILKEIHKEAESMKGRVRSEERAVLYTYFVDPDRPTLKKIAELTGLKHKTVDNAYKDFRNRLRKLHEDEIGEW